MEYKTYLRKANYYETDKMSVVHHSNYIRYFEEARCQFMDSIDCNVRELEKRDLIIPVVDVYARFHRSVRFDDLVEIKTRLIYFNGSRMKFEYLIYFPESGELSSAGQSTHCFVNGFYKPVSVRRLAPDVYEKMKANVTAPSGIK